MAYYYPEPSHTFSEYLLVPGYTSPDCIPANVSLRTPLVKFRKGEEDCPLMLSIPMVSAIMQSVSNDTLAVALAREGVGRVVLGDDFPYEDRLTLLRPVDVLPLRRGCADVLALGALEAEGIPRKRGRVALSGPRLCGELEDAAERLCPQVRGLLINAPGGEDYARYLQAKFGLPVTPAAAGADVTVAFGPKGERWGRAVELYEGGTLNGLILKAEGVALPPDCGEKILALLWEKGELNRERLCSQLIDTGKRRE